MSRTPDIVPRTVLIQPCVALTWVLTLLYKNKVKTMNKYINKIFLMSVITLTGILGFASCTDYLDKSPNSDIKETDPYKNFKNFQVSTTEKMNIGSRRNFVFLPVISIMVISGDGPTIIIPILLQEAGMQIHKKEGKKEIYGNCAGMVSVSQILALPILITWSMLLKKSGNSSKDNFIFSVHGFTLC